MKRTIAILAACAIAGCSGGGGAAPVHPAVTAPAVALANAPKASARLTLTIATPIHAVRAPAGAQRSPQFVSPGNGHGVVLQLTFCDNALGRYPVDPIALSAAQIAAAGGVIPISVSMLAGSGTYIVQEYDAVTHALLAQSPYGGTSYSVAAGVDSSLGSVTLSAVAGGIAVLQGDINGTGPVNAQFATGGTGTIAEAFVVTCAATNAQVYIAGSDADGNTYGTDGVLVPGALPPAALTAPATGITPSTHVAGVFTIAFNGLGGTVTGTFAVTDVFGTTDTETLTFKSCP